MVDKFGRCARRCLLAAAAVALAGAPAALANDADLDPTFGIGGQALIDDPLVFPGKGEQPLNRNLPIDGFQDADGRLVLLTTNFAVGDPSRGDEPPPNPVFRLSRLTAAGASDPSFAAGGAAGESAPLFDGPAPIFARDAHPGPGGSILVLGSPGFIDRGPIDSYNLTVTRVATDGSLDVTFNEGDATRTLFPGEECARVASAGFRPDGKIALFIDRHACEFRGNGVHDELRVVSPDGTIDEAASSPIDSVPSGGLQLAFGVENGQVVTYATQSILFGPGVSESPLVKFGPSGERDLSFGGGKGGVVFVRGNALELVTTGKGAPQVLSLYFELPENRGTVPDKLETVVTRLTGTGQPDTSFGTNGESVLPGARPDLGEDRYQFHLGMTIDQKDRTHLIGTTLKAASGADPVRAVRGGIGVGDVSSYTLTVNRLTAAGVRDATFGNGGEQAYPAPEGQVRYELLRVVATLLGLGTPEFHQADGKLVVPHVLMPDQTVERGGFPDISLAALRLTGTTVDPIVTPPSPSAPAAPAQAVQGASAKKPRTCRSRRAFTVRLRPKRAKLRSAVVTVNGKRVTVRKGRRFTAQINLKGRVPATIRVRIVAKDTRGRTHRETRTYRTCRFAGRPLKNVTVS